MDEQEAVPDLRFELVVPVEPPEKRRMLFMDDRTRRIHSALRKFSSKWDVTIVANVKECLRYLSREEFDEVHLDHDLKGVDFEDPDSPECGMEVVRYIEKCGGWPGGKRKPIFRVHSSNLFAAHLMVISLQNIGLMALYQPFVYDDEPSNMKYDEQGNPLT